MSNTGKIVKFRQAIEQIEPLIDSIREIATERGRISKDVYWQLENLKQELYDELSKLEMDALNEIKLSKNR